MAEGRSSEELRYAPPSGLQNDYDVVKDMGNSIRIMLKSYAALRVPEPMSLEHWMITPGKIKEYLKSRAWLKLIRDAATASEAKPYQRSTPGHGGTACQSTRCPVARRHPNEEFGDVRIVEGVGVEARFVVAKGWAVGSRCEVQIAQRGQPA